MKNQKWILAVFVVLASSPLWASSEKTVLEKMVSLLDSGNGSFYQVNSFVARP